MDDYEQVRQLIARQIRRLDERQLDQWLDSWAEDGTFSIAGQTLQGKQAIREFVSSAAGGTWRGMHLLSQPVIDIDGEIATASTDYVFVEQTESGGFAVTSLRRMHNRLRRTAAEWRYVEARIQIFPEAARE
jgi:uncharacterized protein (TIGR02246 family)